jgi:predicted amidohydrolase
MLAEASRKFNIAIVGGSHFESNSGMVLNVSPVFLPNGTVHRAEKCRLTAFERDDWGLSPGSKLMFVESLRLGVAICYDSEFPEAVRALAEAGARVIAIPAFTETQQGFQRVRWCAHARAIENQVFVIHSSLVGTLGKEPIPSAYGSSAILCPSHAPFPASSVLAQTELNRHGMAIADLDFDALEVCRNEGDVRNWHDRKPLDWKVEVV